MFGITNFSGFIIAGILLNLTPGSDTMFILGRSISQGRKAGIFSALGISTGSVIHTTFAAFGLSMIVAQSDLAFNIIKYSGAVYLFYLGIKMLFTKSKKELFTPDASSTPVSGKSDLYRNVFLSGVITNVLNPKVALFFLAFLPQFVETDMANNPIPFLILGFTFICTGTIWCLILAVFSSLLADKIKHNPNVRTWLERITGSMFIALGIKLTLQSKK